VSAQLRHKNPFSAGSEQAGAVQMVLNKTSGDGRYALACHPAPDGIRDP